MEMEGCLGALEIAHLIHDDAEGQLPPECDASFAFVVWRVFRVGGCCCGWGGRGGRRGGSLCGAKLNTKASPSVGASAEVETPPLCCSQASSFTVIISTF